MDFLHTESFLRVQSDMPQTQSVIKDDDRLITPPGSGDYNKAVPKVSVHRLPVSLTENILTT